MGEVIPFPGLREPWVDSQFLAEHFSVGMTTVKKWRAQGAPCMKFDRSVRFRVGEVEAWLRMREGA